MTDEKRLERIEERLAVIESQIKLLMNEDDEIWFKVHRLYFILNVRYDDEEGLGDIY